MPNPPSIPSERTIVFLVGAIQFVNILDFMMVMPLGPDIAIGLGIGAALLFPVLTWTIESRLRARAIAPQHRRSS